MFARALLDVPYIQLLGRWGSSAVLRYVQEAAVLLPEKAASAVAAHVSPNDPPVAASGSQAALSNVQPSLQDSIKLAVEKALQGTQLLVHNPRPKMCHRPSPSEQQLPSDRWVTFCGKWCYGTSCTRRNTSVLKGFTKCSLCFLSGGLSALPATDSQARDVESGTDSEGSEEPHDAASGSTRPTAMTWPPGPASTKRWERLILEAATKVALDELTLLHKQLMSPAAPASSSPAGAQSQVRVREGVRVGNLVRTQ